MLKQHDQGHGEEQQAHRHRRGPARHETDHEDLRDEERQAKQREAEGTNDRLAGDAAPRGNQLADEDCHAQRPDGEPHREEPSLLSSKSDGNNDKRDQGKDYPGRRVPSVGDEMVLTMLLGQRLLQRLHGPADRAVIALLERDATARAQQLAEHL